MRLNCLYFLNCCVVSMFWPGLMGLSGFYFLYGLLVAGVYALWFDDSTPAKGKS